MFCPLPGAQSDANGNGGLTSTALRGFQLCFVCTLICFCPSHWSRTRCDLGAVAGDQKLSGSCLNVQNTSIWMSFVLFHALFQICFILGSGEPAATFSQSCPLNPPKRASTTAEGFAHDLLMQEQQLLAKESQLSEGLAALTTNQGWSGRYFRNVLDLQVSPPTSGVGDGFSLLWFSHHRTPFPGAKPRLPVSFCSHADGWTRNVPRATALQGHLLGFCGSENGMPLRIVAFNGDTKNDQMIKPVDWGWSRDM